MFRQSVSEILGGGGIFFWKQVKSISGKNTNDILYHVKEAC